jgi:hypothetical protein
VTQEHEAGLVVCCLALCFPPLLLVADFLILFHERNFFSPTLYVLLLLRLSLSAPCFLLRSAALCCLPLYQATSVRVYTYGCDKARLAALKVGCKLLFRIKTDYLPAAGRRDVLMTEYEKNAQVLVADIDCTTSGTPHFYPFFLPSWHRFCHPSPRSAPSFLSHIHTHALTHTHTHTHTHMHTYTHAHPHTHHCSQGPVRRQWREWLPLTEGPRTKYESVTFQEQCNNSVRTV